MKLENCSPAQAHGRERTCQRCGKAYPSPRASSLYCGTRCRKAANRAAQANPQAECSLILKALVRLGMAGRVSATQWGLTVPREVAFEEVSLIFDRKGWGFLAQAEFDAALAADGVKVR